MSASPAPQAFRGSKPTARAGPTDPSRGNRPGHEHLAARKARSTSGFTNHVLPSPSRQPSRSGPTHRPSSRPAPRGPSLYRSQSRQSRPAATSSPAFKNDGLRDATTQEPPVYKKYMENTFSTLGEQRKQERKDAIRNGLLADPDKPTTLASAITIVGTCQDMCAEYERVQRVVQFMVDDCEKVLHSQENTKVPSEDRMVKRYRRPAAGYEEQLPSDIRPPLVLQKTLDYLMDEIVGGHEPLANVHKFVWDRTRAIRNDFSIQQVTKVEELRIAISCFERIARFHILSLHQLAGNSETSVDFDAYQEREQLNNTLLSLIYYYDDSKHKLQSPNEAEFRAYCIIFEIQDQRPDLEDRAQNWPATILKDHRVKTALRLYAAAASASDPQGPLRPQTPNAIAQSNVPLFFNLVHSPAVAYLMACVAEIYFNKVRRMALDTIWRVYKVKRGGNARIEDWTLDNVTETLGFDDEDQAQTFCEEHGFTVSEKEDGGVYVDLGSVAGRHLSDSNPTRKQPYSTYLVEQKRRGRTLPAVINGLTAAQAQTQGLVVDDYSDNEGSSLNHGETLSFPNNAGPIKSAKDPSTNGIRSTVPSAQEKPEEEAPKPTPFQFKPFAPSFISSEKPKDATATSFGKPSTTISSQSANHFATPQFNNPNSVVSSPFSNSKKPDTPPGPFSNLNQTTFAPLTTDTTKPTSPAQRNFTPMVSSHGSIFDSKPSTSDPPKVNFGTSPLFSQDETSSSRESEKQDATFDSGTGQHGSQPAVDDQKSSDPPFKFLNSTSVAPSSTLFSQIPTTNAERETVQKSLPPPFPSFLPPKTLPSADSTPAVKQADKPAASVPVNFAKPAMDTPKPFFSFQNNNDNPDHTAESSKGPIAQSTPVASNPAFQISQSSGTKSPLSSTVSKIPEAAVTSPRPDPRPAVLDALAEGLMMDDQGLLQQFIEFTVGPIVNQAFQEVENDRSWKRAREIRTELLSRKYFRGWKNNVWRKKLLRKGKERRANFARSMQRMARSSRQQRADADGPFQSRLTKRYPDFDKASTPRSDMAPPPPPSPPLSALKRKSLPIDFEVEELPDTKAAFSNKRRRQEPPLETKSSIHSLRSSFQPHHKRSRTMGVSQRPGSLDDNLANFSHLDENAYDHERVMQQARRLVGHAKLDTTRGDYFALKARGADPDVSLMPQPGIKRSRVDEQLERVRKLLKSSSPTPSDSAVQSQQPRTTSNSVSSQAIQTVPTPSISTISTNNHPPNDLLAQVRQVREALAESTAWFQAEREKSERSSPSRSSDIPQHNPPYSQSQTLSQSQHSQPQEWRSTPSRAQARLERTKANGLLPPDWDWNKSVTEWRLRGGTGSPRPGASREQSRTSTPHISGEHRKMKKPIGLAAMTNGLGPRRPAETVNGDVEVYDDEGEGSDQDGSELNDGVEANGAEDDSEDEYPEDDDEEGYSEDEEEEEDENEADHSPEQAELQTQGNSADTAIDLDD